MITTISPLRRAAVTLVLTGATVLGAVAIAPAAFADDSTTVTAPAPATDTTAPVTPDVVVPDTTTAPPVVDPAPAPAPVVTPPPVVIGKDGKPVKEPKVCKDKDQSEYAAKLAKANQQAAPLLKAAAQLRDGAKALREFANANPAQARMAGALAAVGDFAAGRLEAQAQSIITKVGGIGCIVVSTPGGRF
jgi:hypothetical protein